MKICICNLIVCFTTKKRPDTLCKHAYLTTQILHHTSPFKTDFKQYCMAIAFLPQSFFSIFPSLCLLDVYFPDISRINFSTLSSVGSVILARCGDHRAGVYRLVVGLASFVPAQCHHDPVQPRFRLHGLHSRCTLALQSHDACPPQ